MKFSISRPVLLMAVVAAIAVATSAQSKPNQTLGYGENKLLTFTYSESFTCIDQPGSDLNFNGILAENDPAEMQTPICQVGTQPTINPNGMKGNPARPPRADLCARPHVHQRQRSESQRRDFLHQRSRRYNLRAHPGLHADFLVRRASRSLQGQAERLHAVP